MQPCEIEPVVHAIHLYCRLSQASGRQLTPK
jgi:hypothetical protein